MKKYLFGTLSLCIAFVTAVFLCQLLLYAAKPPYHDKADSMIDSRKIAGLTLLKEAAARDNNVTVYGSSELKTSYIKSHPVNYFGDGRGDISLNLMGRGSCQSIIHAMSILASGDSLSGKPVVLITAPMSYVKKGIAPDMFAANFSEQQFLTVMLDRNIDQPLKQTLAERTAELFSEYRQNYRKDPGNFASELMASLTAEKNQIAAFFLKPYFYFEKYLADLSDLYRSSKLLKEPENQVSKPYDTSINWEEDKKEALKLAAAESNNNNFGIENGYYTTYIGSKLTKFKEKDNTLSLTDSEEYTDLKLLLDACRQKNIKPLVVSPPLHGSWSDYTGFTKDKRDAYYNKVTTTVKSYGFPLADFSSEEYTPYFLCDTMHLGWKGWIDTDYAINNYFHENQ